jgi:acyl-CoA reductase-like NAD-dependent aldehyde dehydrogenase
MTGFPTRLFMNGELCRSTDGETIAQINPATEEFLAEVSSASLGDVHTAVKGAQKAYEQTWRDLIPQKRADILFEVARLLRENLETLARLECRNVGKPISEARNEVLLSARVFEYYAGAVSKFFGQTIPVGSGGLDFTYREPMGVVTIIAAWSYPLLHACAKTAPALAAGNAVVLKPASRSPFSAILLGQLGHEAGLPAGVLQVLPCAGGEIGEALVSHPLVRKIAFTGSTEVGVQLMVRAARDLKRVSLELGGKSPCLIFADADIEAVAACTPISAFGNAGQNSCARSRIFVESTVYDRFVARFVEATKALQVGDPMQKETQIGPLISNQQREIVEGHIDEARKAQRTVAWGGDRLLDKGFFLRPAIFLDVETTDPIWIEGIFGPIVCIRAFDEEEEVLRETNNSPYGLSASVWTRDLKRALRLARRIEAGVVSVNTHQATHVEAPFGGCKHSGLGRHFGMAALDEFTELKNIYVAD